MHRHRTLVNLFGLNIIRTRYKQGYFTGGEGDIAMHVGYIARYHTGFITRKPGLHLHGTLVDFFNLNIINTSTNGDILLVVKPILRCYMGYVTGYHAVFTGFYWLQSLCTRR